MPKKGSSNFQSLDVVSLELDSVSLRLFGKGLADDLSQCVIASSGGDLTAVLSPNFDKSL